MEDDRIELTLIISGEALGAACSEINSIMQLLMLLIIVVIPSLAGVQNVSLTAGDTPTALLALTDMLYSCPDCSGISVDVNGELTVILPLSVKCCSDGQVMLK